jgi:hypothetical protein
MATKQLSKTTRTERLETLFFKEEISKIVEAAEQAGLHTASWVRAMALREARKQLNQGAHR